MTRDELITKLRTQCPKNCEIYAYDMGEKKRYLIEDVSMGEDIFSGMNIKFLMKSDYYPAITNESRLNNRGISGYREDRRNRYERRR